MNIVSLFPPYLYSIQYGDGEDEYNRLMGLWSDVVFLSDFFDANCSLMDPSIWNEATEPEVAASIAFDEAYELEHYIEDLNWNTAHGQKPDFDSLFKPLDGEYVYEWVHTPMKAYGPRKPSLLRLYAIKMGTNCYLITGGGIKIFRTMQESPELQQELIKIDKVRSFLREQGIENQEDF